MLPEKIVRLLYVRSVAAQPEGRVLVQTNDSTGENGYKFTVLREEQPLIGQRLKLTLEDAS